MKLLYYPQPHCVLKKLKDWKTSQYVNTSWPHMIEKLCILGCLI